MERRQPGRVTLELLLLSVVLAAVNALTPTRAGFLDLAVNPYLLLTLLVAATYGKYWSFVSLAFSTALAALAVPALSAALGRGVARDPVSRMVDAALPFGASLAGGYIFGIIRDNHYARAARIREKARSETRDVALLEREIEAIQTINMELEERVSRQQDSLTYLYTRIQGLYSLNLDRGLETILEMVERFSGATSCSIWVHQGATKTLGLAGSRGWPAEDSRQATMSAEGTIEGWVVRNNLPFSVRMLLSYENLKGMDRGRNIITLPISAGRRIWGVLNIEEMPFEKYNQYTEKLLSVLIALSAPAIERALEYATAVSTAEVNETTGLPSFSSFYRVLERSIQHAGVEKTAFSVVIFELANFAALAETDTERDILSLYPGLAEAMVALSSNRATVYHYKEDSQLAVIYPQLDRDGAVLFGLNVLEKINTGGWSLGGRKIPLEMILGYGVLDQEHQKPDDLLRAAESLLEMQKI